MTIIKATCPCCGDVELTRDKLRLVVHPVRERSFYSFECPSCLDDIRKPAGAEVIRLLKLGGVEPEQVDVPAEAAQVHDGPPITEDDLLDFCAWIQTATTVAAAAGAGLHERFDIGGITSPKH